MFKFIHTSLSALVDLFFPRDAEIMESNDPPLRSWKEIVLILGLLLLLTVILIATSNS